MRHLTNGKSALAALSLALFAAGCNKGPAEGALKAADEALVTARPEIERYVPEELASLTSDAQAARSELEKGHYTEALKIAQGLPARTQAAVAVAAVAKEKLVAAWNELAGRVPGQVQSIGARVTELEGGKALPKGMDKAALAAARTDLGSVNQAWIQATAAYQGGDVRNAVRTARDVEARAEALGAMLGLAPPPAPIQ